MSAISSSKLNLAFFLLLIIFPSVALTVRDAGSIILVLLFLFSIPKLSESWNRINRKERMLAVWFMVFFLVMLFGVLNSENIHEAIRRLEPYSRILAIPFFYMGIIGVGNHAISAFIKGILIGSVFVVATAIYQVYLGRAGIASGAYHHIIFGEFSVVMALILVTRLVASEVEQPEKLITLGAAGLYIIAAILSTARGAWLAFPVVIVVIGIITHRVLSKKTLLQIVAGVLIVIVVTGFLPKVQERLHAAANDIRLYVADPEKSSSIGDRLNMWRDALIMFRSSPLFGVGTGDFKLETERLIQEKKSYRRTNAYSHAHSIYFDTLATSGIFGLLALLIALFLLPLKYFLGKIFQGEARFTPVAGTVIITCYAIFGLSETWIVRNPEANVFAISLAVFLAAARRHADFEAK